MRLEADTLEAEVNVGCFSLLGKEPGLRERRDERETKALVAGWAESF